MTAPAPLLLDFRRLTITRGDKVVLQNFNLQVRRGEHVAILGPNGSGKSTLIKLMTGELHPQSGIPGSQARLFGQELWALEDIRRQLGIVALDLLASLSHEVTAREVTAREMVLSGFSTASASGRTTGSPRRRNAGPGPFSDSWKSPDWPVGRSRRCHRASNAAF